MADINRKALFDGTLTHPTTKYVGVPIRSGRLGAYIAWTDATSSATITLEVTSFGPEDAPVDTAGTYQWKDSGVAITGPAASAAGAAIVNQNNLQQRRARLKIVTVATSKLKIYDGTEAG
jgi:hypothetical protein